MKIGTCKRFLLAILFAVLCGTLVSAGIADEHAVGWWNFDEEDNKVIDNSANGNDGDIFGNAEWVEGISGLALHFNGLDTYVLIPHSDSFDFSNGMTMEAWVKFDNDFDAATDTGLSAMNVIQGFSPGKNIVGDVPFELDFRTTKGGDTPPGTLQVGGGNIAWNFGSKNDSWKAGQWYFLAATYDNKDLIFYLDGEIDNQKNLPGEVKPPLQGTFIGAHHALTNWFEGVIDEIRISDIAITQEEIRASMRRVTPVDFKGQLSVTWGGLKSN